MSAPKSRKKSKHRGSLRTTARVRYVEVALTAALADPGFSGEVALLGNLFPPRRGLAVTPQQLTRALSACHPDTGKPLRARVNAGTRREGDSFVANVCHGFDIPLAVDKSVSIAALLFGDKVVCKAALDAMRLAAKWLGARMDRRLRKHGQNATVSSDKCAVFFLPEKGGRDGQPQLHAHLIFPNVTSFEEDGRQHYCAGHFKRIAKLAMEAQRRMNRQMGKTLVKSGYVVELVDGVCRLPSVPRTLCAQFSPVSALLDPEPNTERAVRRRRSKLDIRYREDQYLKVRPDKVLLPLGQWQGKWVQSIGASRFRSELLDYEENRYKSRTELPAPAIEAPQQVPVVQATEPALAPQESFSSEQDVLEDRDYEPTGFKSLGVTLRKKIEAEFSCEERAQVCEVDYFCHERARNLVEHTEALRTLLRLIFPRLVVHQKFTAAEHSSFKVTGAAVNNPKMAQLVVAAASALEAELGQLAVGANWPALLRWLHAELASRPPEPVPVRSRRKVAPAFNKSSVLMSGPAEPSPVSPAVIKPDEKMSVPPIAPEWDMMP